MLFIIFDIPMLICAVAGLLCLVVGALAHIYGKFLPGRVKLTHFQKLRVCNDLGFLTKKPGISPRLVRDYFSERRHRMAVAFAFSLARCCSVYRKANLLAKPSDANWDKSFSSLNLSRSSLPCNLYTVTYRTIGVPLYGRPSRQSVYLTCRFATHSAARGFFIRSELFADLEVAVSLKSSAKHEESDGPRIEPEANCVSDC